MTNSKQYSYRTFNYCIITVFEITVPDSIFIQK